MSGWQKRFREYGALPALLIGGDSTAVTYLQLADAIDAWLSECRRQSIGQHAVVSFPARYDLPSVGLFFALMEIGSVLVPLPPDSQLLNARLEELAAVTHCVRGTQLVAAEQAAAAPNALYLRLRAAGHAGLVLFTSGTTGDPKGAVHDLDQLCLRYRLPRSAARILAFMQIDHIGGINTLLYCASNAGALVSPSSRSPEAVCRAIEQHSADVLPTSPTFLNMMLTSGCLERFQLDSLKRITYGSEPMPSTVLERINRRLPDVEMLQTYGTTELGILKSKSRDNGSLWMKVGGEGYDVKIVDGRLWIRAETAMLGYINAPYPFDDEGYMDTGDEVEIDGDWLRIVGRRSESINVGGLKVAPIEVESVLLEMPGVLEASVCGEAHPLTGQIVTAVVRLTSPEENLAQFKIRMRAFCHGRLASYAIPARVRLAEAELVTDRFKRAR